MVRVAICDDETTIGKELKDTLTGIFAGMDVAHEIELFLTSAALCKKIEEGVSYSLLFLDIEFAKSEINGIEVGKLIRESDQNKTTAIVYISWEKKYAMQLFDIRPMNFLIKPLEHEKIRQVVTTYLMLAELGAKDFIYKKGYTSVKVPIHEVAYLENHRRKIIIHFANGRTDDFYGSLKEIYSAQLKKMDFLFIHASYAVNYDYITMMKYNEILVMGSETPLPVSPNKRNEVREHYLSIIRKRKV